MEMVGENLDKQVKYVENALQNTTYYMEKPKGPSNVGSIVVCVIFILLTVANIVFNFWYLPKKMAREPSRDCSSVGLDSRDNTNGSVKNTNEEANK